MPIDSIAIFGPGLLGGSLLHDAKRLGFKNVRAWARKQDAVDAILRQELAHVASTEIAEVANGASFLVLTSPVGAYESLAQQIAACSLDPNAIVTDVGSVKGPVIAGAGRVFREGGITFVGSHPMAGSEVKGLAAAAPRLFENAPCLVTPEHDSPAPAVAAVRDFWEMLGSRVTEMNADLHDQIVGRISHMPHLAAVAVTLAALRDDPTAGRFGAGGLRDTTRVASGDPAMWQEILLENREAVLAAGDALHRSLGELLEFLRNMEHQPLLAALTEAKRLRESRYPPAITSTSTSTPTK